MLSLQRSTFVSESKSLGSRSDHTLSETTNLSRAGVTDVRGMPISSNRLKDHIAIIAKHEEEFSQAPTTNEHVADLPGSFIGSLGFLAIHVAWFTTANAQ
jgi:hypothetical protein